MGESAPVQESKDQSPQGPGSKDEGNSKASTSIRSIQSYLRWALSFVLAIGGIAASLAALNAGYRPQLELEQSSNSVCNDLSRCFRSNPLRQS
jgi:hypothetical protein